LLRSGVISLGSGGIWTVPETDQIVLASRVFGLRPSYGMWGG
jgi:hypothetical protein